MVYRSITGSDILQACGVGMFMELAKPVTLIGCILSLYAVFYVAFLDPMGDPEQRIGESLALLACAAVLAVASALIFREAMPAPRTRRLPLTATLPWQMFCWAASIMAVLFVLSSYLETHCVFYRDLRWY